MCIRDSLGTIPGTIGETSVIAIMIGAIFLLLLGIIDLRIPGTYIATFVIFISIFGGHGFDPQFITAQLCGGGLMLGAWFMATDYVTSPITKRGQIVYGMLLGILTGLFRLFGGSAEGVSYAIIISNMLVPLIEDVYKRQVVIGISFPRYSMRTLKALEFASNRKAKVITLTDSVHSPMTIYSSCNLIARSDMASIVDSLVAPLSVINALVVALCMKKQKEVVKTLETLEEIWDEYQVYSGDELNQVDDRMELGYEE